MIKAYFDKKTKESILKRDKGCVACGTTQNLDCHHVYFGQEAEYTPDRNNIDKGVILCREHHEAVHSCRIGEGLREYLKYYLYGTRKTK